MIRWGVLATGFIAGRFVTDLRQVPDAQVTAVGSRTIEAARRFAEAHGIGQAFGSWQELAASPDVDIVYVATPHAFHHAASMVCLRAGKPLLIEKPLALDVAQTQDVLTFAREQRLLVMEAMWMRTLPAMLRLRQVIDDGTIGDLVALHAAFALESSFEPGHRLRDPLLGGGALLDLGVYAVHFAQMLLGAPQQIRAWAHLHPEGTDARTGAVLGFAQGQVATLYCGVGGEVGSATIVGTKGRIEFPDGFYNASRFVVYRSGSAPEVVTCAPAGLHFQAIEAARCLRAGLTESPLVPHAATLHAMRTLDAIRAQIGVGYEKVPAAARAAGTGLVS